MEGSNLAGECSEGWVELIEQGRSAEEDNNQHELSRHRVRVKQIEKNYSSASKAFRSSTLRLSSSASDNPNGLQVSTPLDHETNRLWGIASKSDWSNIQSGHHYYPYLRILPAVADGKGFIKVTVESASELNEPPAGTIIIKKGDDIILKKHGFSWEGSVPVGRSYSVNYEVMGETFWHRWINIEKDVTRIVSIGGADEFGTFSLEPYLFGDSNNIKSRINYLQDIECLYTRNEMTTKGSCISDALHQGEYRLNLTSEHLLFPVSEKEITISPGETTKLPNLVGGLLLKKTKKIGGKVRRNAVRIMSGSTFSKLFAFGEDTAKLLPVGSYKIELQEAGTNQKVVKDLVIKPGKVKSIDVDNAWNSQP